MLLNTSHCLFSFHVCIENKRRFAIFPQVEDMGLFMGVEILLGFPTCRVHRFEKFSFVRVKDRHSRDFEQKFRYILSALSGLHLRRFDCVSKGPDRFLGRLELVP